MKTKEEIIEIVMSKLENRHYDKEESPLVLVRGCVGYALSLAEKRMVKCPCCDYQGHAEDFIKRFEEHKKEYLKNIIVKEKEKPIKVGD